MHFIHSPGTSPTLRLSSVGPMVSTLRRGPDADSIPSISRKKPLKIPPARWKSNHVAEGREHPLMLGTGDHHVWMDEIKDRKMWKPVYTIEMANTTNLERKADEILLTLLRCFLSGAQRHVDDEDEGFECDAHHQVHLGETDNSAGDAKAESEQ
ncbi:hypothetical protein DPEC_G00321220 [Dallia pectoralis]|uniref:Uncharacterized protein n=1 Tax=Dallia pectoralis TaxID=75939 RepID=A0ACC2F9W4_DALPE|nr:hypothetical protein DPEC_G00321220 [Dallia pectoralis]